jgi:hypothetical protein
VWDVRLVWNHLVVRKAAITTTGDGDEVHGILRDLRPVTDALDGAMNKVDAPISYSSLALPDFGK